MSAVDQLFTKLRNEGRKAFIPFVTAGDPDLEFTAAVLRELATSGSSLCEIGIPYSDPIADGPVIQTSYTRALARRVKLVDILATIKTVTNDIGVPVVTMVSYAIIHRLGPDRFVDDAKQAGLSGAIVPDLLLEESGPFASICRRNDFNLIQLTTPTTPRDRAIRIAETSTGFLYYVSVTGITGERTTLPDDLVENVGWLRQRTALPICIGFGINQPQHVKLLAPVADGLIVGSAFVRRIATAVDEPSRKQALKDIRELAIELQAAMA